MLRPLLELVAVVTIVTVIAVIRPGLPGPSLRSQQTHFWVFLQENGNQDLEETSSLPCSLRPYSQQPRRGNNLNVHQQMNRLKKCGLYIRRIIIGP